MTKNKKKMKSELVRVILIVSFVIISVVMIFTVSGTVNDRMTDNQLKMLDTVAERITDNMRSYFNQQWERLEFVEKNLQTREYRSGSDVLAYLGVEEEALGFTDSNNLLFLVDYEGFYHSVDRGKIGPWHSANTVFASSSLKEEREISINALSELQGRKLSEYLCFVKMLDQSISAADGSCFTHMILAADKSVFDINLSLSSFGTITDTFVVDSLGRKINAQTLTTDLAKSYNILQALQQAEFLMGASCEELEKDFTEMRMGSSMVCFQDVNYYISYRYMGVEDWFAVFLVNEKDMISDVKPLAFELIARLTVGFTLLVLLAGGLLIFNSRESLMREREIQKQLSETAEIADKANQAKSVFLSRMSHDIRTPINGIIGMTNIAKATIDDPESVKNCLKKITSSSEHLYELINEVLEITRIESGKTELRPEPMNLLEMLDKLNDMIESKLLDKSLLYEVDFGRLEHPHVTADENIIKQVLLNLLGNAVKYTPDGGRVKCTVYDEPSGEGQARYHFLVEDTGIGMKQEFLEHIFERFSQESITARTTYEGTGLGMAITKEFVDLMEGTIAVESEVGRGSRFEVVITLPFREENEEELELEALAEQARSYHILVAEDNEINRTIVEFILTENGSTCELVGNGRELVERFEHAEPGEFDAIMTDIRMPVMGGLEAVKLIRAMPKPDAATIPIFAMTANAYRKDQEASLEAGMNAHLTKPLEAEKIMAALREFCI